MHATIADRSDERDFVSVLSKIATVLAPTTAFAALMYYFGWVRTQAFYAYFGIDADDLNLSNSEYVLRSAPALWLPLVVFASAALISLLIHTLAIAPLIRASTALHRRVGLAALLFGLTCLGAGALLFVSQLAPGSPAPAVIIAAGLVLIAYGRQLLRALSADARRSVKANTNNAELGVSILLSILILLSLFWTTQLFADSAGTRLAQRLERANFNTRPDVIVYSAHRLHIDARNVTETNLGAEYTTFRFRYEGLKLLSEGGNKKLILIPYSWSTQNPYALIVSESDDLAIVFAPNL